MSEEEFSCQNRLYWWRPLLGPQSVNRIDGGRATCGDYRGDGGAKSQRHHSCQPGPQVIGIDPVQSYSEMTHIKGPWNGKTGPLFPTVLLSKLHPEFEFRNSLVPSPRPLPGFGSSQKASTATISNTSSPRKRPDPQHHSQASLPVYFLAGRGIRVTPTCSSAVYGDP